MWKNDNLLRMYKESELAGFTVEIRDLRLNNIKLGSVLPSSNKFDIEFTADIEPHIYDYTCEDFNGVWCVEPEGDYDKYLYIEEGSIKGVYTVFNTEYSEDFLKKNLVKIKTDIRNRLFTISEDIDEYELEQIIIFNSDKIDYTSHPYHNNIILKYASITLDSASRDTINDSIAFEVNEGY